MPHRDAQNAEPEASARGEASFAPPPTAAAPLELQDVPDGAGVALSEFGMILGKQVQMSLCLQRVAALV